MNYAKWNEHVQKFYLLWASSATDTAMQAAHEEILDTIRSTGQDYAY